MTDLRRFYLRMAADDVDCWRASCPTRGLREARLWSQRMLAEIAGVSKAQIEALEAGRCQSPGLVTVGRLARALSVEPGWLAEALLDWLNARPPSGETDRILGRAVRAPQVRPPRAPRRR